ncbi:MAG: tetratricopeptide repeat protein [Paludibacteraceae bacterium]|nr:tetratricopeptide repeat protein [Paludibacteraceae bacterium]
MRKNNDFQKPSQEELDAVRRYEHANRNAYFDAEEFAMIVEHYLDKDDDYKASEALKAGLRLHPDSEELKLKEAQMLFVSGNYNQALKVLMNEVNPDDSEALFWRGNILVQKGEIEQAVAVFDKLLEQEKNDEYFDDLCYDIARTFKNEEYFTFALPYLEKGLKFNPKNTNLLFHYITLATLLTQYELAKKLINRILDDNPYHQYAWYLLAEVCIFQENYPDALEAVEYAVLLDKKDFAAWRQKGRILYELKRYAEAVVCFKRMLDLSQSFEVHAEAYALIGDSYEQAEDFETALYYYQECIKINQILRVDDMEVLVACLYCMLELERYAECETFAEKLIKQYPDVSDIYCYYADACLNLDKDEKAKNAYQKSLELNPNQPSSWVALGNIYFETDDFEEALKCYLKAYDLDAETENINLFLAMTYYKMGEEKNAIKFLTTAYNANNQSVNVFLEICPEGYEFATLFLENLNSNNDEK